MSPGLRGLGFVNYFTANEIGKGLRMIPLVFMIDGKNLIPDFVGYFE